ncbi:hypothetical protein SAMN05192575_108120 [Nocardioides alpinus]|uniref:Uncharacterized protein n=1 Tax=Nocardioides alpinus TaxID=748909 RepID=A0A1I1ABR0_9ACTN|nr:hypothetical protein [Nocardioides alpinus]PKH43490.1 hypothetical protein CXG46_03250 [Nocardioides alpinus]SFB35409.1 hypothetical protein SAMN05192575_108120 [Nocardioides alpinus]
MHAVPEDFLHRPFRRAEALASGITRSVLQGPQFRRVHEAVYCHVAHDPSFADRIAAARLALPPDALTTGITTLQEMGIDHGPRVPLHFVVQGTLHLAVDGIFLHRTVKLPPSVGGSVSTEAAFVAYCAEARLIDAVKVGCELLRLAHLDLHLLDQLLIEEKWRRGVAETTYVLPFLDDRCRSMPEAELLTYVVCAGLPQPEVNSKVELAPGVQVTPDLWWLLFLLAVEYEGSQHQEDRAQYNADIDRYAAYRRHGAAYELVTKERMRTPKTTVRGIHAALVARGYDGPAPDFGARWDALFQPVHRLVRRPHPRGR